MEDYEDWDRLIPFATKFTPYQLVYDKSAQIPSFLPAIDELLMYERYLEELVTYLGDIRERAGENLIHTKELYERHLNELNFKVGDQVLTLKEKRLKVQDYYDDPYTRIEILNRNTAILENEK